MNKVVNFETALNNTTTKININNIVDTSTSINLDQDNKPSTINKFDIPSINTKIVSGDISSNNEVYKNPSKKAIFTFESSGSNSKKNYVLNQNEYSNKEADRFLSMLRNDIIETGYYSSSELFLKSKLVENPLLAKSWLNTFFYENLNDPDMLVKLLHIISDIDYDIMKPEGPIIAMAAVSHKDLEVKEYAIGVFEKWGNQESLNVLQNISFKEKWLQDYAEEVIEDLKEELV